ncbi:MAG: hypothetical protein AB9856_09375 [Cellulosilyticaceae bacterium]
MKIINYEDLIMKRAMDLFAQEGLRFFGIDKEVKELGPTELVVLESKNMFMDYTFLMEDDTYIRFEFQTTNKGIVDLKRFRAYEALLSHQTGKDLTTHDIIELTFTPIMGGKQSKVDKILQTIRLVKNIDKKYRYDVESILYAFVNNF